MHKLLYVCLDGLGDDPIPAFDGRTPLEAADTPTSTRSPGGDGPAGSSRWDPASRPSPTSACSGSWATTPRRNTRAAASLEAMGIGMDFRDGDLAYRINFATGGLAADRRSSRRTRPHVRGVAGLADEVNDDAPAPGATFDLRATIEHRGALVIRATDRPLVSDVTNTDPAYRTDRATSASRWKRSNPSSSRRRRSRTPTRRGAPPT